MNQKPIAIVERFVNYHDSVATCLDRLGAGPFLCASEQILIKPNLVNSTPFPVTTSPEMIRALVAYIRANSRARVIIAEGCGDARLETGEIFTRLGFTELARELDVELVDLNHEPVTMLKNPHCRVLPTIYLPKIALKGALISVPVLKRHSLAGVTLTMKNMLGLAPPQYYRQKGSWKKSFFHNQMHRSILELNLYRAPDLSLIDATVGMAEYHLGGRTCDPAVNRLVAGFDPVRVDALGAALLGLSWRDIPHIRMAHGLLGKAEEEAGASFSNGRHSS
ncbi:DUF362 domain-containing protein [Desulfobulbus alkaliphilus]|uniref:DUF362 domain-containing protein n=1 Tax=Desulfobulbus alkaliphilus TaxID=869814 RepID=UPI00196307D9|nr:DUF362 domain-containing protein [Desulfobulbus alkaliphilus]MBM9536631.1 DUF362 domain-containing protein [Desulfobulbus alkaliphilus]